MNGLQMNVHETLALTKWAAQECEWQQSGEQSVHRLCGAWHALRDTSMEDPRETSQDLILMLGWFVEPSLNPTHRFRTVNVQVGNSLKPRWDAVPRLMHLFLESELWLSDPTEAFREFEEIHPFRDGNGRVGALLFNLWSGTLEPFQLQFPPNLWADPRRDGSS